ncbi:MAG: hypothetical protein H0V76_00315 [Blastocatellia bacterium]|nr:hypothetical protein [Blastocatellia bacterium]
MQADPTQTAEPPRRLGKLIAVHGAAPASLQRAAVAAVLAFIFFLGTLLLFYTRQHLGYFMISSAFLVVYLLTLSGIWMQKRRTVKLYENGLTHRKESAFWQDITAATPGEQDLTLERKKGAPIKLPASLHQFEHLRAHVLDRTRS